ncbi:MAG: prepilin-type N-terminal cleavage/methylation domain-containing protein [Euryarchaeota archaeon]|nr:prepilin-type N-terminal cleavage/methylation domain-containing protein [Euryarchaeota archaeon]
MKISSVDKEAVKKRFKVPKRFHRDKLSYPSLFNRSHSDSCMRGINDTTRNNTQQLARKHAGHSLWRLLRNQRGVTVLELLVSILILTFLVFGAIDYDILKKKHQYAEHTMHKYLQRMQIEGRLSISDENSLKTDFSTFSCPVANITAQRESQGNPRILRNPYDINESNVTLKISCKPVPQPLLTGRLVRGNTLDKDFRIVVGGAMLSERVYP